jgi:hypothetical protein
MIQEWVYVEVHQGPVTAIHIAAMLSIRETVNRTISRIVLIFGKIFEPLMKALEYGNRREKGRQYDGQGGRMWWIRLRVKTVYGLLYFQGSSHDCKGVSSG